MKKPTGEELYKAWLEAQARGMTQAEHAASLGMVYTTYASRIYKAKAEYLLNLPSSFVKASTAPAWTDNEQLTGDALILSDVETPYHHAGFINQCIRLAKAWGIPNLVLAGDFVHFENFSTWGADFKQEPLKAVQSEELLSIIRMVPQEKQAEALERLEKVGVIAPESGISAEMATVRQTVKDLSDSFENIYYRMGNHENRKLRKQDYGEGVSELLRFLGAPGEKWKAAPYYWMYVVSGGQKWRIEHPKGASASYARDLAVQYHCHVAMGHSHRWAKQKEPSGDYYALQIGHCVDEERLAYVMQRSAKRDAHCLGALILRNGYPFLLAKDSPFDSLISLS